MKIPLLRNKTRPGQPCASPGLVVLLHFFAVGALNKNNSYG